MSALTLFLTGASFRLPGSRKLKYDYVIMIAGIAISVAILCTALNLFEGYEKSIKQVLLESNSHIIISSNTNNALTPKQATDIVKDLSARKEIRTASPVYVNSAMLKAGKKVRSIMIKAYPELNKTNWFSKYIVSGTPYSGTNSITLGSILARDMGLKIGDKIELLTTGLNPELPMSLVPRHESFTISGIIKTGFYEADKSMVFIQAADAYQFYTERPHFSYVEAYLKSNYINQTNTFTSILKDSMGQNFLIQNWIDFHGSLFSLITIEKWLIFLVFSFLALIAALNCVSTVSTSIVDRQKEIAILSALGTSSRALAEFIYFRVILVCLVSIFLGLATGTALSYLITKQGIYQLKGEVYFIDTITMQISGLNYLAVFITTLLFISFCVYIPLKRIRNLSTVEVIRGK